MSRIINLATEVPEFNHKQAKIAEFMSQTYESENEGEDLGRKLKLLYERSGIDSRYSVIPDFFSDSNANNFFPKGKVQDTWPDVDQRMDIYNKTAIKLAQSSLEKTFEQSKKSLQITHLITVSCTGMSAPGLDIELIEALGLDTSIDRTSVNFMGCYAAIHGLKQADYICRADPNAVVAMVCVEICTIHFQNSMDKDNQTANMLFADGAASCLIIGENVDAGNADALHIDGFFSELAFGGKKDMAWNITSKGFQMVLSAYIPDLIKSDITLLLTNALAKLNLSREQISNWAVHPGGRKILEVIGDELGLKKEDLQSSYEILRNYGNMSSSTILFVLKNIFDSKSKKGEKTMGVAFGPGLTLESMILTHV